jgi:hypothetical protein
MRMSDQSKNAGEASKPNRWLTRRRIGTVFLILVAVAVAAVRLKKFF